MPEGRKPKKSFSSLEEMQEIREKFQRERPSMARLKSEGHEFVPTASAMALIAFASRIRHERLRQGLSLAEVAEKSGIDEGALSRLETGKNLNPTFDTLARAARAIGFRLAVSLEAFPENSLPGPGDTLTMASNAANCLAQVSEEETPALNFEEAYQKDWGSCGTGRHGASMEAVTLGSAIREAPEPATQASKA